MTTTHYYYPLVPKWSKEARMLACAPFLHAGAPGCLQIHMCANSKLGVVQRSVHMCCHSSTNLSYPTSLAGRSTLLCVVVIFPAH